MRLGKIYHFLLSHCLLIYIVSVHILMCGRIIELVYCDT